MKALRALYHFVMSLVCMAVLLLFGCLMTGYVVLVTWFSVGGFTR